MKNFKLTILGAVVLVAALALNLRHALNDYGIRDNKLHVEVLAQTNNSGGDGSNNGDGSTSGGNFDAHQLSGSCTSGMNIKQMFSSSEVNAAKAELGVNASSAKICKWLLSLGANASFSGQTTETTTGGWEITFTSSSSYTYLWVQCLNQTQVACNPVARPVCD